MEDVQRSPGEEAAIPVLAMKVGEGGCCPLTAGRDRGAPAAWAPSGGRGRGGALASAPDCPAARAQPRSDGHSGRTAAAPGVPGEPRSGGSGPRGREGAGYGGPALIRERGPRLQDALSQREQSLPSPASYLGAAVATPHPGRGQGRIWAK